MNNPHLTPIHQITLQVNDIPSAIKWYKGSFDCNIINQTKTEALLEFANVKLALVLPSQVPGHLAFLREDADSFGELRKGEDGLLSCFVSDSNGNPVKIVKPAK